MTRLKRMNILKKTILAYCSVIFCISCSLNIPPADQYSDPDAITSIETARSLLASTYAQYPHCEYELSILSNDFCPNNLTRKDMTQGNLYAWQDKEIYTLSETLWTSYYATIASCNTLIERLSFVETHGKDEQQELSAIASEVKTLKAMCYFNLLRLYAPAYDIDKKAPGIILKEALRLDFLERSTIEQCVTSIRSLLQEAVKVDNHPEQNGWLSQDAAYYLLAELELYAGNYEAAIQYGERIIGNAQPDFFTTSGIEQLWGEGSSKVRIFAFSNDGRYLESMQYTAQDGDFFSVNPQITYTGKDLRAATYSKVVEQEGHQTLQLGKYNMNTKNGKDSRYIDMMRYAGAYFIVAESYAQIGLLQKATTTINNYLAAIKADPIADGYDKTELIAQILVEKQKEFVGEGVSFFDLKRIHLSSLPRLGKWGIGVTNTIKPDDYRWSFPIPRSEYRYNDYIVQNKGWSITKRN